MLKEKTAVVTGASRGIGEAVARELAKNGVNIAVLCSHSADRAEELCRFLRQEYGVLAEAYLCDVKNSLQVTDTVNAIQKTFGKIDILVNNAGITRDKLAVVMTEEEFDVVLDTNLKGAFLMSKQCLALFVRQRKGVIINVSSISGMMGNPGQANYAASKAGLIGLTKTLAREYAKRNIRCNAVAPGFIETDMTDHLNRQEIKKQIPLQRMGTPEDVAKAVVFLADAEYITGVTLRVDGGMAI